MLYYQNKLDLLQAHAQRQMSSRQQFRLTSDAYVLNKEYKSISPAKLKCMTSYLPRAKKVQIYPATIITKL